MDKVSVSDRIKEGLRIRGLKQSDLVAMTGIGKSSISTYISGAYEPKQRNIYKIARALYVNEAWLMGYDVPMERSAIEYNMEYGKNLRSLRESKGLTRDDLAALYNEKYPPMIFEDALTAETISFFEEGQREINYKYAFRFSELVGSSPDEIMSSWSSAKCEFEASQYDLVSLFEKLDEDDREQLIRYATFLYHQRGVKHDS